MKDSGIFLNVRDEHASINLVTEICCDLPLTKFKQLEKYRDNLKILFNERGNCWTNSFIDECVACAQYLGNIKINPKTVEFLKKHLGPNFWNRELLDVLATLYKPNKITDYIDYFRSCRHIFGIFYGSQIQYMKEYNIDSGNNEIDALFSYLINLLNRYEKEGNGTIHRYIYGDERVISVIFAYIHYHKLNDYSLIDKFLSNPDYYCSKLVLNNKWIMCKNDGNRYDPNNTMYLFNNMEKVLTYDNKITIK